MSIHPTALVDRGASIGRDAVIGPYVVIDSDVTVGDGAVIGPHAVIHRYTTLGANCRVHAHAVLGGIPQDTAFKEFPSYVRIGAGTLIREHVTIHRGTKPETATEVGEGCFLMVNSHLGHNVKLGNQVIIVNAALLAGYVEVGDRAFVSGNVVLHQFVRVGRLAMLSGLSGISKDVPPFCTTAGLMPNSVGGLNVVGMRRAGIAAPERLQIKRAFDLVYRSGLNVSQAVERIRAEGLGGAAAEFGAFAESSKRGICRFIKTRDTAARAGDEESAS